MIELLLILPVVIGFGVYELFTSDNSSSTDSTDNTDTNTDNTDTNNDSGGDTTNATLSVLGGDVNADDIKGGADDDFVAGGASNDTLQGRDADDVLLGEAGDDSILGTQGYDTLLGGAGDDTMVGGRGQDWLIGGEGDDSINGGEGDDTISGSSGADILEGFKGNDVISGIDVRSDSDNLAVNLHSDTSADAAKQAADLDDYVVATYGTEATADIVTRLNDGLKSGNATDNADDQLFGGRGNDTLIGDYSDTLTGGNGSDAFQVHADGANEAVTITDLNTKFDTLNITVPDGTNPNAVLANGATPEDGVSVVIAGDVVAVLKGLTTADIPAGFIKVTVATV